MEFTVKSFNELTTRELYEILRVRCAVFSVEQKMNCQDLDEIDFDSIHIYLHEQGRIIAYFRCFLSIEYESTVQIGRCLTTSHHQGYGRMLMEKGMEVIHERFTPDNMILHAQKQAVGFYEKFGFVVCSDEYMEEGIPHYTMKLK